MNHLNGKRQELNDLRQEWSKTWPEYSKELRTEIGTLLATEYLTGSTLSDLCDMYGTKDRRTIIELMELSGLYKRGDRNYYRRGRMNIVREELERDKNMFVIENLQEGTITVNVPDVAIISWSEKADKLEPKAGSATITWRDGIRVSGDAKLHAEKMAGNDALIL